MLRQVRIKKVEDMTGCVKALTCELGKKFYVSTFPLRKEGFLSKKIVACVFSVGEKTEEQAVVSVKRQRWPVSRIELIRNVTPIAAASNRVFDMASDADYVLWVDADMILYEHCLTYLVALARSNALFTAGGLIDPVFGVVGWIKLLNMSLAKRLGIRFKDVLRCDVDFCNRAKWKDSNIIPIYGTHRKVLGIHHRSYTAKEIFRKTQIRRKKANNQVDKDLLLLLTKRYVQTGNTVLLAGILGTILPNPDNSQGESFPESGLIRWKTVSTLLENGLKHHSF